MAVAWELNEIILKNSQDSAWHVVSTNASSFYCSLWGFYFLRHLGLHNGGVADMKDTCWALSISQKELPWCFCGFLSSEYSQRQLLLGTQPFVYSQKLRFLCVPLLGIPLAGKRRGPMICFFPRVSRTFVCISYILEIFLRPLASCPLTSGKLSTVLQLGSREEKIGQCCCQSLRLLLWKLT